MAPRYRPVPEGAVVTSGFGPRWGTEHRGTDFDWNLASREMPVYAAQGGTVVHSGAASGFGGPDPAGWLVIDHPAADGAGTTVYGHIIREVNQGQRVEAGQRIGRTNPDRATNGGVEAHLHFEVHPYSWLQGSQIDPIPWLGDAPSPGETVVAAPDPEPHDIAERVIYGVDISNHQNGILAELIGAEGFRFCIIKASEGTWRDPILHSHLADVRKSSDMHVAAYVYVRHDATPQQHADTLADHLGDTSVPVALDIEHGSGSSVSHFKAIRDAIQAKGYRVILTYLPEWYWKEIGRPSLEGLPPLWTSRYPDMGGGFASVIYQRAGRKGWDGYGGLDVAVWQFTSTANVANWQIDANAYYGTERSLAALFGGEAPLQKEELDMSAVQEIKDYIDVRLTGPVGSDVKDIRQQLTGGRDAGDYRGWPQLGQDAQGRDLTVVDALAALRHQVADLAAEVAKLKEGKR